MPAHWHLAQQERGGIGRILIPQDETLRRLLAAKTADIARSNPLPVVLPWPQRSGEKKQQNKAVKQRGRNTYAGTHGCVCDETIHRRTGTRSRPVDEDAGHAPGMRLSKGRVVTGCLNLASG